ncbi:unnamed protein product [Tilletia controversa]|nr:unnamed protein product [Tilletia controversa]
MDGSAGAPCCVSPGGGCSLGGQLMRLNALNLRKLKHMGAPDMNNSKTLVTSNTREVFAGMICGGMELAELDGFGWMPARRHHLNKVGTPLFIFPTGFASPLF